MYRCSHCKALVDESELVRITEDPSPSGISLPAGEYEYLYCPYCGDDAIDEFNLTDAIDITEGEDECSTLIEFEGKKLMLYLTENGTLAWSIA